MTISSITASTTSSSRAPSRSSSWTISAPAGCRRTSPNRSSAGMARACRENGCALLGGETAEMPGFYADGEYDLAGFIVGVVDRARLINGRADRHRRCAGRRSLDWPAHQRLLAGPADRLRSSGARASTAMCRSWARPSARRCSSRIGRICRSCSRCSTPDSIKGMAHITGGGITDNLPRILPNGTAAGVDASSWDGPAALYVAAGEWSTSRSTT